MKLNESIGIVMGLRKEGLTYQAIGQQLKISRQRVYQIIQEANKVRDGVDQGLSKRNRKLLIDMSIGSKEQAIQLIANRSIKPFMQKNYGYRSFNELCAWAGIDARTKSPLVCPHCHKSI